MSSSRRSNDVEPVVVSHAHTCTGSPRLRGTRLYLSALLNFVEDDDWYAVFGGPEEEAELTRGDIKVALEYCAQRRCREEAVSFCSGCSLLKDAEGETFEEWVERMGVVEKDDGPRVFGRGFVFLGSMEDLREDWEGRDCWLIAERLLEKL